MKYFFDSSCTKRYSLPLPLLKESLRLALLRVFRFQSTRLREARPHYFNSLNLIVKKPINCEPIKIFAGDIIVELLGNRRSFYLSRDYEKCECSRIFMYALGSHHNKSKPFRSNTGFAPMCSTLRSQLLPR